MNMITESQRIILSLSPFLGDTRWPENFGASPFDDTYQKARQIMRIATELAGSKTFLALPLTAGIL